MAVSKVSADGEIFTNGNTDEKTKPIIIILSCVRTTVTL